mmetsp:Transcript_17459/g.48393  ORF Transcript_17459/g.48393 Transcript_17459/m.48393 type:complete len:314 (+) Transcript_17459:1088-2029(+)
MGERSCGSDHDNDGSGPPQVCAESLSLHLTAQGQVVATSNCSLSPSTFSPECSARPRAAIHLSLSLSFWLPLVPRRSHAPSLRDHSSTRAQDMPCLVIDINSRTTAQLSVRKGDARRRLAFVHFDAILVHVGRRGDLQDGQRIAILIPNDQPLARWVDGKVTRTGTFARYPLDPRNSGFASISFRGCGPARAGCVQDHATGRIERNDSDAVVIAIAHVHGLARRVHADAGAARFSVKVGWVRADVLLHLQFSRLVVVLVHEQMARELGNDVHLRQSRVEDQVPRARSAWRADLERIGRRERLASIVAPDGVAP